MWPIPRSPVCKFLHNCKTGRHPRLCTCTIHTCHNATIVYFYLHSFKRLHNRLNLFLHISSQLHNREASTAVHNLLIAHMPPLCALFNSPTHVIVHMFTFRQAQKWSPCLPPAAIDWLCLQNLPQIRIRICCLWSDAVCCLLIKLCLFA